MTNKMAEESEIQNKGRYTVVRTTGGDYHVKVKSKILTDREYTGLEETLECALSNNTTLKLDVSDVEQITPEFFGRLIDHIKSFYRINGYESKEAGQKSVHYLREHFIFRCKRRIPNSLESMRKIINIEIE